VTITISSGDDNNLNGATVRLSSHEGHLYEQRVKGNAVRFRNVAQSTYTVNVTHLGVTNTVNENLQIMSPEFTTFETMKYIGGIGPAGGIVFYDKGNSNHGWRFLEAAPTSTEFNADWGPWTGDWNSLEGHDVTGTETGIGTGRNNTRLIIAKLNQLGQRDRAAQLCDAMKVNGFSDWFLPSKDELNLMYINRETIGGFGRGTNRENWVENWRYWVYWSSSQSFTSSAWGQGFGDGAQHLNDKHLTLRVRAVRAF
jgi:hypothetical protein